MDEVKGGRVDSCSRIDDGNWGLASGEDELRRISKDILRICII